MSSLIFYIDPELITIATDTLVVSAKDNSPFRFSTKFYVIPHIQTVICGTGYSHLLNNWAFAVNSGALVNDILHLDHHTPAALRDMFGKMVDNLPSGHTATIYHFGFPADGTSACGFAYRSTNGFVSEQLSRDRCWLKPEGIVPPDATIPESLLTIMESQRVKQELVIDGTRVHIGGDILVCRIDRQRVFMYKAANFPDKEVHRAKMYENYGKENSEGRI